MRIIQLTAENIKKLTVVQITPTGAVVQVTGKNGQGKTSVLDAIWWALAGAENVQTQPIRRGAERARIQLQLGDGKTAPLVVDRRFTEKASYLEVRTADGAKYPSPQRLLDELMGALTLDPLGFMRMDRGQKFSTLRGLVRLDVDPEALDAQTQADRTARTELNREARQKESAANNIETCGAEPGTAPVDEGAILTQLQEAAGAAARLEQEKFSREEHARNMTGARNHAKQKMDEALTIVEEAIRRAEALRAEADRVMEEAQKRKFQLQEESSSLLGAASELEQELAALPPLPAPPDTAALRKQLEEAQVHNRAVEAARRKQSLVEQAETLGERADALTTAMEAREAQKREALARAEMPVPGLSFGEGVVTYRDLPLEQASDAEQLMVSTAIAAALNPKLRVLRIRDGSLLDTDAMAWLETFAEEHDFQVWVERVDGSGTVGVVMEDGHVRGQQVVEAAE